MITVRLSDHKSTASPSLPYLIRYYSFLSSHIRYLILSNIISSQQILHFPHGFNFSFRRSRSSRSIYFVLIRLFIPSFASSVFPHSRLFCLNQNSLQYHYYFPRYIFYNHNYIYIYFVTILHYIYSPFLLSHPTIHLNHHQSIHNFSQFISSIISLFSILYTLTAIYFI